MPRKLPWETKDKLVVATQSKRPVVPNTIQKRSRLQGVTPDFDRQDGGSRKEKLTASELPPSSSPLPEVLEESFMIEGVDHDDKFRMVEDEFLSIAQTFTAHLHAAEYRRQQKMVKSRNAKTINSISRPVTGGMPDHTRRKIEGVARSIKQQKAIEAMLGKKKIDAGISDDSDDGVGLPYVGTTLHGLMDSPRRTSASISKAVPITATTRAAAGFNKPATITKPSKSSGLRSPKPKYVIHRANSKEDTGSETSGVEDDDLDAPILAPKLISLEKKSATATKIPWKHEPPSSSQVSKLFIRPTFSSPFVEQSNGITVSHDHDDIPEFLAQVGSRPSRVRARHFKAKKEPSDEKKLDEIPDFF